MYASAKHINIFGDIVPWCGSYNASVPLPDKHNHADIGLHGCVYKRAALRRVLNEICGHPVG
jgi:hypothetical protein